MAKTLRKVIKIRSRLKNHFNKARSAKNLCAKLLRKTKKDYFSKVHPNFVSDRKKLLANYKPYFSDKDNFFNKIIISEKYFIVSDDRRLSEIFNEHFIDITKTLDLKPRIICTTSSLPEIIQTFLKFLKLLKIILELRKLLLYKGRSVSSSFIMYVKIELERLFET